MITILGNLNNAGFALPMVSASPLDVNAQYVLGWNPTEQALDYIPFVVGATGDIGVVRDLAVARDAAIVRNVTIGGTLGVTGVLTTQGAAPAVIPAITGPVAISNVTPALGSVTATGAVQGLSVKAVSGANNAELLNNQLNVQAVKVVGARATGWAAMTGTPLKTTFATGTITLPQLAGLFMALQADLIAHGLIGA